ncbi:hypothetical protein CRM22_007007 [Opisthorchis felineus]|uniref:Spermatogenesis-associated protein 6 N-terminal domain-containing protein n=1 Tax=Opisthorchis felineus TaxID=147828 RepID=A0A4S2LI77_OPIFE|nr:hypothetical protein CRM22_007007 [Opisthorchis felineus]
MQHKTYKCHVELRIHWACSPGTNLSKCEGVYLSVDLFGVTQRTKVVLPFFPLLFNEEFSFEKHFHFGLLDGTIHQKFKEVPFGCELRQLCNSGCDKLLAYHNTDAFSVFLKPNRICGPSGRRTKELIFRRTVEFCGPSPRVKISSLTSIFEITPNNYDCVLQGLTVFPCGTSLAPPTQRPRVTFTLQAEPKSNWNSKNNTIVNVKPDGKALFCECEKFPTVSTTTWHSVSAGGAFHPEQSTESAVEPSEVAIADNLYTTPEEAEFISSHCEAKINEHSKEIMEADCCCNVHRQSEVPKLTCLMHEMWHLFYPFKDTMCPWNNPPVRHCEYPESPWVNINGEISVDFKTTQKHAVRDGHGCNHYAAQKEARNYVIGDCGPHIDVKYVHRRIEEEQASDLVDVCKPTRATLGCVSSPMPYRVTTARPTQVKLATIVALPSLLSKDEWARQKRTSVGRELMHPCSCQFKRRVDGVSSTRNTPLTPASKGDPNGYGLTNTCFSTHGSTVSSSQKPTFSPQLSSSPVTLTWPQPDLEQPYKHHNKLDYTFLPLNNPSLESAIASSCDVMQLGSCIPPKSTTCPKRILEEKSSPSSHKNTILKPTCLFGSKVAAMLGAPALSEQGGTTFKAISDCTCSDQSVTTVAKNRSGIPYSDYNDRLSDTSSVHTKVTEHRSQCVAGSSNDFLDSKPLPDPSTTPVDTAGSRIRLSQRRKYSGLPPSNALLPSGSQVRTSFRTTPTPRTSLSAVRKNFRASLPMADSGKSLDIQQSSIKNVDPSRKVTSDGTTLQMHAFSTLSPEELPVFAASRPESLINNFGSTIRQVDSKCLKDFSRLSDQVTTKLQNMDFSLPSNSYSTAPPDGNTRFQFVDPSCAAENDLSVDTVISREQSKHTHQGLSMHRIPGNLTSHSSVEKSFDNDRPLSNAEIENQISSPPSSDPLFILSDRDNPAVRCLYRKPSEEAFTSVFDGTLGRAPLGKQSGEIYDNGISHFREDYQVLVGQRFSSSTGETAIDLDTSDSTVSNVDQLNGGTKRKSESLILPVDSNEDTANLPSISKSHISPPTDLAQCKTDLTPASHNTEAVVKKQRSRSESSQVIETSADITTTLTTPQLSAEHRNSPGHDLVSPELTLTAPDLTNANLARIRHEQPAQSGETGFKAEGAEVHLEHEQPKSFATSHSSEKTHNGTRVLHIHLPTEMHRMSSKGHFQQAFQIISPTRLPSAKPKQPAQPNSTDQHSVPKYGVLDNGILPVCLPQESSDKPCSRRRPKSMACAFRPQVVLNIFSSANVNRCAHCQNEKAWDKCTSVFMADYILAENDCTTCRSSSQASTKQSTSSVDRNRPIHAGECKVTKPYRSPCRRALTSRTHSSAQKTSGRIGTVRKPQTPSVRLVMTPAQYQHMIEVHHLEESPKTGSFSGEYPGSGSHNVLIRKAKSAVTETGGPAERPMSKARERPSSVAVSCGTTRSCSLTRHVDFTRKRSVKYYNTQSRPITLRSKTKKPFQTNGSINESAQCVTRSRVSVLEVAKKLIESQQPLKTEPSSIEEPAALGDSSASSKKFSLRASIIQALSNHRLNFQPGMA